MNPTVLVIDDSRDIHDLLDVRLRSEGLSLLHAYDADEGMRVAQRCQPSLILLDIEMPGTSGLALCRELKSDPSTTLIPVIFLSAADATHTKVLGFNLGAVDYVTKPFDAPELRARVRSALRTSRYQEMLATRAQIDALTGIWNRGYFDQRLREEVAAARRYGRGVSLVMLDLDHFKALNDEHGHPFGDRVLQTIGEILSAALRSTDAACRYGGEEFGLILSESNAAGAWITAERVRQKIADATLESLGCPVKVTASLGIASMPPVDTSVPPLDFVKAADDALYRAKRGGRNRTCGMAGADAEGDPTFKPRGTAPSAV